ncbi:MAG TPA: c-type cytochrome [Burkholderiales bacterium]|jgi:thiosulfate dehydrogenase
MRKHLLNRSVSFVLPCIAAAVALLSVPGTLRADELGAFGEHSPAEHLVLIDRGGVLYDKWYGVLGTKPPKETHPAYPKAAKQKGASTWRCKECHGWDYKGARGAYSKGSHYTGIVGIRNMTHAPIGATISILKSKTHGFGGLIPEKDLEALAHFVAHGQIDTDNYVDRATKKVRGDPARGERIYQTTCARCHGSDGKQMNFNTPEDPEYIGTVASENPWETLHKIRMGQPGVPMISMLAFDIQDHLAILAYAQTLPQK